MKRCAFVVLLAMLNLNVLAIEVSFTPEKPGRDDEIKILLSGCDQGGILHWGVNARGNRWQQAIPAYRPVGSLEDGVATRTEFEPDQEGVARIKLGPFNDDEQEVGSIDFAIQWNDGSWDTMGGKDYHVFITSGRISIRPSNPTLNDVIEITVHRSKPGGELRWGVNARDGTWNPPAEAYWPAGSIPSDDGLAIDSPVASPVADGTSTIRLGPFNKPDQVVTTLHLAVHWGKDWDTNFGRNFNVDISPVDPDGPSLSVLSPIPGAESEHSLAVEVQSDDAQRISLWLDGNELSSSSDKNLRHELDLTQIPFGSHDLVAVAERDSRLALRQVQFWRMPPIESAEVEGDPAMGATMNRDGTATFVLLAPGKRFVSVVGSFNNWNPRANPMKRASDGRWWTTFPIEPGTHTYQYSIDGALLLADPYSREVVWQNEAGIETHEPANAKTVFSTEPDNFEWDDQGFRTPPLHDLIVYELYIPDLCPGEGFEGLTAKLDYIRDLGVTAIEPLPVNEFAGRHSWGYNPAFHLAPERSYGAPRQLKTLINEAHKRGLAVIMDMVLNHMCWNSPLCALYGKDFDASPYFRLFLGENWGFPDCDQESPAFKQYVADMLQFWVREYHIDGFRYDATRWTGWKGYNDWGASWFAWAAKQADSNSIQIAEHLPPEIELINETEMDTGWDSNFRWRLREMLVNARLDREVFAEIMDPMKQGYLSAFGRMPYLESHDEERVMRELLEAGYSDEEAARRAETGLALVLTAPGVPMLYAGQEFGERTKKVVGWNPLNWTLLSNPRMQQLHKRFKDLTMLRRSHPALVTEEVQMLTVSESENIVAYERLGAGKRVVVATNFGRSPGHVEIPVNPGSQWRDILGHSEGKLEWSCFTATLPPGGAVVLSDL